MVADRISLIREFDFFIARGQLAVGDRVSFDYQGQSMMGTLTKKNQKTVYVRVQGDSRLWKVHPLALKKI